MRKPYVTVISLGIAGWYLFLAVVHWLSARPLWNDEYVVSLSVTGLSAYDLFHRTLMVDQVFPRVYLWCVQQVSAAFDFSLVSLRALSFASMITAFFVWARVARREIAVDRLWLMFLLSWVASIPLVYYTAELKQYSMDVCVAGVFVLFLQHQQALAAGPRWRYYPALFCLPLLGLFSYPAFLFLVFPFWQLVRGKAFSAIAVYGAACALALGLSHTFDMRLASQVMTNTYNDHFIWFDSPGNFVKTLFEGINDLVSRWFSSKPVWIRGVTRFLMTLALVEMFIGAAAFLKDRRAALSLHMIAFVIFCELVLLGALHKYPFTVTRTTLFFCPVLFIMVFKMFGRLEGANPLLSRILQSAYGLFLAFLALRVTFMVLTGTLPLE